MAGLFLRLRAALRLLAVCDQVKEGLVDAGVVRKFGVESCRHHSALPDGDGIGALSGDDFDAGPDALDLRSADEYHF